MFKSLISLLFVAVSVSAFAPAQQSGRAATELDAIKRGGKARVKRPESYWYNKVGQVAAAGAQDPIDTPLHFDSIVSTTPESTQTTSPTKNWKKSSKYIVNLLSWNWFGRISISNEHNVIRRRGNLTD